jgi:hypothetical protein
MNCEKFRNICRDNRKTDIPMARVIQAAAYVTICHKGPWDLHVDYILYLSALCVCVCVCVFVCVFVCVCE